jgi:hypothetical protein
VVGGLSPSARGESTPARAALGVGLVLTVVGTFLPWLRSGQTTRNSYASDGVARRLLHADGPLNALLHAWPFVSLACALALALLVLGLVRSGAAVAVLAAVCAAAVSVGVLTADDRSFVRPDTFGPIVTLSGSGLTLLAVLLCLAPRRRSFRSPE